MSDRLARNRRLCAFRTPLAIVAVHLRSASRCCCLNKYRDRELLPELQRAEHDAAVMRLGLAARLHDDDGVVAGRGRGGGEISRRAAARMLRLLRPALDLDDRLRLVAGDALQVIDGRVEMVQLDERVDARRAGAVVVVVRHRDDRYERLCVRVRVHWRQHWRALRVLEVGGAGARHWVARAARHDGHFLFMLLERGRGVRSPRMACVRRAVARQRAAARGSTVMVVRVRMRAAPAAVRAHVFEARLLAAAQTRRRARTEQHAHQAAE